MGKEMLGKWSKKPSKRVVFAPRLKVEGKQHRWIAIGKAENSPGANVKAYKEQKI